MAYGGRPLWSRSPRSSPSRGKPGTWRRRTGGFDGIQQGGMQNARRRNCIERHTRTRRTRIAAGEHLSAAIQPEPVPAGLRSHLLKPGSYDQRSHRRDRGRYVAGENRPHHRSLALRAVPVDAGATGQHSQAQRQDQSPGHTDMVGQAAARGHPDDSGSLLRAAVLRPLPRLSTQTGLPHRLGRGGPHLDGHTLVRRGRHQGVLRQHRPRCPVAGARREAPRQPFPTPAQAPAESGLHRGLEVWPHAERNPARRNSQPHPRQRLPGPVGQVRRARADSSTHPRHRAKRQPTAHTSN